MVYRSEVICNTFIQKGLNEGVSITPMKAIKLVYLAHGWFLGKNEKNLISDAIEAWRYGPVIPVLYNKLKKYKSNKITSMIDLNNDGIISKLESNPKEISNYLESIWNHYKEFTGTQLSTITHEIGSPWHTTYYRFGANEYISNDLIKQYYLERTNAAV